MPATAIQNGERPEGSITGTIQGQEGEAILTFDGEPLTNAQPESTAFQKTKCVNSDPPLVASVAEPH